MGRGAVGVFWVYFILRRHYRRVSSLCCEQARDAMLTYRAGLIAEEAAVPENDA